ncbi:hypothetical protein B0T21DRAFT_17596 [Apiosordaria backusii]|uniref:Uncharacterized protein n=1 Tax=Apiosordaria backusii TaxID=314023 RepID=A0AA40K6X1_9PEZI|nr:hypothetical protein B0T21DRAFT_17596 [Apiosordaria backusii]
MSPDLGYRCGFSGPGGGRLLFRRRKVEEPKDEMACVVKEVGGRDKGLPSYRFISHLDFLFSSFSNADLSLLRPSPPVKEPYLDAAATHLCPNPEQSNTDDVGIGQHVLLLLLLAFAMPISTHFRLSNMYACLRGSGEIDAAGWWSMFWLPVRIEPEQLTSFHLPNLLSGLSVNDKTGYVLWTWTFSVLVWPPVRAEAESRSRASALYC